MYRSRTVRELLRQHQLELARRDEMIQTLLDRIQHPDRTPIWREPVSIGAGQEPEFPWQPMFDPEQLP